jgi:hypothetical protein
MVKRILSIIGWLGTGLVLVAVAIRFGFPARDQIGVYMAWAGLACVLVYALGQWREIVSVFGHRRTRYGTLAGVSFLVMLGILIAVNYIGARQNKRWDLTANKQFSLSDQSRQVLAKLDAPLEILVFTQETQFPRYQDKIKEYEYASKRVSAQYVDPDKKPTLRQQYQVQQDGTIVFNYKGRTERVTSDTEQDLTNGIIKVVSGEQKKVYFTEGHAERDPKSAERDGYNTIGNSLGRENYLVDKVVLAQTGAAPDDAAVVVIAGPKVDFLANETAALKKYLDKGGKVMMEIDPPDKVDSPPLSSLIALAHDWGIDIGKDIVVDISEAGRLLGTDASVTLAASYPSHPITQRFRLLTMFPLARSVTPVSGGVNGHIAQAFVQTSPQSWAETDIKGLLTTGQPKFEEAKGDKRGPISVAAAVSAPAAGASAAKAAEPADAPKPETRLVVFGDSDFASNAVIGVPGNRDLFMADRRIIMTAAQQVNINWLSIIIIPGFIFAMGAYTWWRRR